MCLVEVIIEYNFFVLHEILILQDKKFIYLSINQQLQLLKKERKILSNLQLFSIGFCELGNLNLIAAGMSFPVNTSPMLFPSLDNEQLMMSQSAVKVTNDDPT